MGSAEASGSDRAKDVIEQTINSPLLNNNDIRGARKVLLNITSGSDEITVDEIGVITDIIIEKVGGNVNTIWGTCTDETLGDLIRITLVATGFGDSSIPEFVASQARTKTVVPLDQEKKQTEAESLNTLEEEEPVRQDPVIPLELLDQETPKMDISIEPPVEIPVELPVEPVRQKEELKPVYDPYAEENEQRRRNAERLKALNYTNMSDPGKVDELEREPAYKRKQLHVQTEMFPDKEEKSRYTMGAEDNHLRPNNTYLHDAVD